MPLICAFLHVSPAVGLMAAFNQQSVRAAAWHFPSPGGRWSWALGPLPPLDQIFPKPLFHPLAPVDRAHPWIEKGPIHHTVRTWHSWGH